VRAGREAAMTEARDRLARKIDTGGAARAVAFSPDGTLLAFAGLDRGVYLATTTGHIIAQGTGHRGPILGVDWAPDGRRVASGSDDGSLCIWDRHTGALQLRAQVMPKNLRSPRWSPGGERIAVGSPDGLSHAPLVLDAATGDVVCRLEGHRGYVR